MRKRVRYKRLLFLHLCAEEVKFQLSLEQKKKDEQRREKRRIGYQRMVEKKKREGTYEQRIVKIRKQKRNGYREKANKTQRNY